MCILLSRTFDYLERELHKIPMQLPVLVLANHRDMGHHRTVTEDQARTFIESFEYGKIPVSNVFPGADLTFTEVGEVR